MEEFDSLSREPLEELWNQFDQQTHDFADFIIQQEKTRLQVYIDKANENCKQIFKENQKMVSDCSLLLIYF